MKIVSWILYIIKTSIITIIYWPLIIITKATVFRWIVKYIRYMYVFSLTSDDSLEPVLLVLKTFLPFEFIIARNHLVTCTATLYIIYKARRALQYFFVFFLYMYTSLPSTLCKSKNEFLFRPLRCFFHPI